MQLTDQQMYDLGRALAKKATPQAAAKVEVDVSHLNVRNIESKIDKMTDILADNGSKDIIKQIDKLQKTIQVVGELIPEPDFADIVSVLSAIPAALAGASVDNRPELANIALKLDGISDAIRANTEQIKRMASAIERQADAASREKVVKYDSQGRIISIK